MISDDFPTPGFPFPMQGPTLKAKLDEAISQRLSQFGVAWLGDYRWVQPGETAIRRIVNFVLIKGASAVISWGYSLSFVPRISGSRLSYHPTPKSARADVFEYESSYDASVRGGPRFKEIVREVRRFDSTLDAYLRDVLPQMEAWWSQVGTLSEIEAELERQRHTHQFHHPHPGYVLAFVRAAAGERKAARQSLDEWIGLEARSGRAVSGSVATALESAIAECRDRYGSARQKPRTFRRRDDRTGAHTRTGG